MISAKEFGYGYIPIYHADNLDLPDEKRCRLCGDFYGDCDCIDPESIRNGVKEFCEEAEIALRNGETEKADRLYGYAWDLVEKLEVSASTTAPTGEAK